MPKELRQRCRVSSSMPMPVPLVPSLTVVDVLRVRRVKFLFGRAVYCLENQIDHLLTQFAYTAPDCRQCFLQFGLYYDRNPRCYGASRHRARINSIIRRVVWVKSTERQVVMQFG